MNFCALVSMVVPVVTVTYPFDAPAGTVAKRNVVPVAVTVVACMPLNFTIDEPLNPWPRIPIFDPTFPLAGSSETYGARPISSLNNLPLLCAPPVGQAIQLPICSLHQVALRVAPVCVSNV